MKVSVLLATLGIGLALGVGLTRWRDNAQVVALQAHADSAARSAAARDSAQIVRIKATNDSLAVLRATKAAAKAAETAALAGADSLARALAAVTTAADSIPLLNGEVLNLRIAVAKADARTTIAEAETQVWRFRALKAETDVGLLNDQIQDLNTQIQALNHHALPKWFRVSLEVVKLGGAAYAGYQVGKKA